MLAALKALQNIALSRKDFKLFEQEIFYKKTLLIVSIISTIFMCAFFAEHRLLCRELGEQNLNSNRKSYIVIKYNYSF